MKCPHVDRVPILLSALIALAPVPSGQNLQFQPRVDFDLATELPRQAAMADFDHDGNLDLVVTVTGLGGGRIDVHFGDGNSDFGNSQEIPLDSAEAIGLGDFDADGWMDIAAGITVVWHQDVHIFRNDHNGGFTHSSVVYPLAYGPLGLATADFDADGQLDLAVASTSSSYALTWFPGNGNMTFGPGHVVPSTGQDSATRLISADFNNDGKPDLAMSRTTGARVFVNPLPGFQFQNAFNLPVNYPIGSLVAVNVDGDGILDLVTESDAGHLGVWHGVGDGTFTLLHDYAIPGYSTDIRAGDINSDGRVDVMVSTFSGIQLYLGMGGGAFSPPQTVASGVQPMACGLGDWNGDGRLDLAVACNNNAGPSYMSVHEQIPPTPPAWINLGFALAGAKGLPQLSASGALASGGSTTLQLSNAANSVPGAVVLGTQNQSLPVFGGVLVPNALVLLPLVTGVSGLAQKAFVWPLSLPAGLSVFAQAWLLDAAGVQGFASTNALSATLP
jgi:hypothetical protein